MTITGKLQKFVMREIKAKELTQGRGE